jgi:N-acetylmuramic acid 6-phosphate etherase
MAVAGSTRMQATTFELLVVGSALEEALNMFLGDNEACNPIGEFSRLLQSLESVACVDVLSELVDKETEIYKNCGLVTYFADRLAVDIFTDTTERAPTFSIPPFVKRGDSVSPQSWAFVKNPLYGSQEAWEKCVFGRKPRCLDWTPELYRELGVPDFIPANPPKISCDDLYGFMIGNDDDNSRYNTTPNIAFAILGISEQGRCVHDHLFMKSFESAVFPFDKREIYTLGFSESRTRCIPCRYKISKLRIMESLAIKLIMNTVSTATCAKLGRIAGNWMSFVTSSNKKLIDRCVRLISELCELDYETACYEIFLAFYEIEKRDFSGKEIPSPVNWVMEKYKRA